MSAAPIRKTPNEPLLFLDYSWRGFILPGGDLELEQRPTLRVPQLFRLVRAAIALRDTDYTVILTPLTLGVTPSRL